MKIKRFLFTVLVITFCFSLVGCSAFTFLKPLPTYTPQATYTPQPTYTPNPTLTPNPLPDVPVAGSGPAGWVTMSDMSAILLPYGFEYAGDTAYGGCSTTCEVYEFNVLGLSTSNYEDGAFVISAITNDIYVSSDQERVTKLVIGDMFGQDLANYISDHYAEAYSGIEVSDVFDRFGVYMKSYDTGYLIIAVSQ
jgi:hypothetical protein